MFIRLTQVNDYFGRYSVQTLDWTGPVETFETPAYVDPYDIERVLGVRPYRHSGYKVDGEPVMDDRARAEIVLREQAMFVTETPEQVIALIEYSRKLVIDGDDTPTVVTLDDVRQFVDA